MKPRTLKDLEEDNTKETSVLTIKNIKEEAIKLSRSERIKHMSAIDFILWWFDITEEDLK